MTPLLCACAVAITSETQKCRKRAPHSVELWHAAHPQSERSVGGPVIICLLFHLPTFMACGPSGPAYHCLSALFAPVMARGLSSERALRRRPSDHLPFVSFAHLCGARPERTSLPLPFCPVFPCYGARPERASLSFAFLLNLLPLWCTARAGQLINALLLYIGRGPSGPAYHLRGPSEPVCHLPLCLICGAPHSVRIVLHGQGNALLFYLEWSRTPPPRCPRLPNVHALRTKLILL